MSPCDSYASPLRQHTCRWRSKRAALLAVGAFAASLAAAASAVTTIIAGSAAMLSSGAGEVRDLTAVTGSVMYAATQGGGLWKTNNAGVSWAITALPARFVWKIAVAGNTNVVYAATTVGLFKSGDGGATWAALTSDSARAVAVDPNDATGNKLLLGVPGVGILRSPDGGTTFADVSGGLDSTDVRAIVYDPGGNAYAALFGNTLGGNWGGVFKLPVGNSTWVNWNTAGGGTALDNKFVTSLAASGTVLLAGTMDPNSGDGRVHRSLLSGGGWSNPTTELNGYLFGVEALAYDRSGTSGNNAFYAGSRALCTYRSVDGGQNWVRQAQVVAANTEACSDISAIGSFPGASSLVIGSKGSGLFYTTTPSASAIWTRASGLAADRVRAFAPSPAANTFFVALQGGGVRSTPNGGASWSSLVDGLPTSNGVTPVVFSATALAAHPTDPAQVLAGFRGPGLYALSGSTWNVVNGANLPAQGGGDYKPQDLRFDASGANLFYSLFDGQGVYLRTAGAWSLAAPGAWSGAGAAGVYLATTGTRYALMYDQLPLRQTAGTSAAWAPVAATDTGFMRLAFRAMSESPITHDLLAATNKGLFRSTNDGANWTYVSATGLPQTALSAIVHSSTASGTVWAADPGGNFSCSSDGGTTWTYVAVLPAPALALRLQGGQVWALTDGAGIARLAATCP
jgi:hypothetical protein